MRSKYAFVLALAACGEDVPGSPAKLELRADPPPISPDFAAFAFDANNSLVCADGGNAGLHRLEGATFKRIPGTELFAFGTFGFDRDRALLVGGPNTSALVKLP